jgi:hypothetical protein
LQDGRKSIVFKKANPIAKEMQTEGEVIHLLPLSPLSP